MRVISLACSNTEIVCALDCADRLVGVDDHSDRPVEVVSALPRVGPDLQIDIERVRALEPDLVLASLTVPGHEKVVEGLERAGLPYLAPEPESLAGVYASIHEIAAALGVSAAGERLARDMQGRLHPVPIPEERPALLVQWWPKPVIAPGKRSWVNDLIGLAGGRNPFDDDVRSQPVSDEEVRDADPDAVILSWCGVEPSKYRPDVVYRNELWQGVKALRAKHVACVPEAHLGRPGPGLVEGFEALKQIVASVAKAPPPAATSTAARDPGRAP